MSNKPRPKMHPLQGYMLKHAISMEVICETVGVSRITVWRWFKYHREPTLSHALKIHAITNGRVPIRLMAIEYFHDEFYTKTAGMKDSELL